MVSFKIISLAIWLEKWERESMEIQILLELFPPWTGMPSKQCFFQPSILSYLLKDTMQVLKSHSQRWALILEKLRVSFSTLKKSLRTLILILSSQKIPWELSFSFSTLKKILERSHSRSRLSVNLLSQKSGSLIDFQESLRGVNSLRVQFG